MPVHFLDRVHRPASGPVAVGIVLEVSLEDGSVFIETNVSPVFAKNRHSEAAPDGISDPVSDDRTRSGRG
jgi:hypothetical protein